MDIVDDTFERLKARRQRPGAASSADFQHLFTALANATARFRVSPAEPLDSFHSLLRKVQMRRSVGQVSDYLTRLCVGVLAFGRVRQADIFVREHALTYWIAEGHRALRFHPGDCYMKTPSGAFQQHRGTVACHRIMMECNISYCIWKVSFAGFRAKQRERFLGAVNTLWTEEQNGEVAFLRA